MAKNDNLWLFHPNGNTHWSDEAKLYLISFIRENIIILNNNASNESKREAWSKVYDRLIEIGMPKMRTILITKIWAGLKMRAFDEKKKVCHPIGKPMRKIYAKTIELFEEADKLFAQHQTSTAKLQLKREPASDSDYANDDGDESNDDQTEVITKKRRMSTCKPKSPKQKESTLLTPLRPRKAPTPPPIPPSPTNQSPKYWKIMEECAQHDLDLKKEQRENEEEKMEFARDLHQKNMILLDLKIKVQTLQIKALEEAI